ncbi:hypothetical protein FACS1894200_02130 [Spirochaetia bacterium]|nr:hypothetical protein FACS1894200_02130 [Spirochaetia bacterium]
MILRYTVEVIKDGNEYVDPTIVETEIPDEEEYIDGSNFMEVFGKAERNGIPARNEAANTAIGKYLNAVGAKKKTMNERADSVCTAKKDASMCSEFGDIAVNVYQIKEDNKVVFNSNGGFVPPYVTNEHLTTLCFNELLLYAVAATSMRVGAEMINRYLHLDGSAAISARTLANKTEREGQRLNNAIENESASVLAAHDFNTETGLPNRVSDVKEALKGQNAQGIAQEAVLSAIEKHNKTACAEAQIDEKQTAELLETPFEDASSTTSVFADDILVSKQKETGREKNPAPSSKHWVVDTVIQIQNLVGTYTMVGSDMPTVFLWLTAFLLANNLLENKMLVFFTDGARNIKNNIQNMFGWRQYTIILDWYHLQKKCGEYLSMALKGITIRKAVWANLGRLLWIGQVDKAIAYLRSVGQESIKNVDYIEAVIAYLEKNKEFIPCYAIRKRLGLRNSSNPVETSNNIVVAKRQKANGMSWSKKGSVSIANISAVIANKGLESWVTNRDIGFRLVGREEQNKAA